jgi:hypothetical protein
MANQTVSNEDVNGHISQQVFCEREGKWIADNQSLLEQHKGEWFVIEGDRLIAHNVSYRSVLDAAHKAGIETPFIYFVPTSNEPFVGV